MEFNTETFPITKTSKLTCDICYVDGHPIVKAQSIVLNYNGTEYKAGVCKSFIHNTLIKHLHRPIYVVELINYLNRLINGENMFNIYNEGKERTDASPDDLQRYTFNAKNDDLEEVSLEISDENDENEVGGTPHFSNDDLVNLNY